MRKDSGNSRVISSDLDGADLHREKLKTPYYVRTKGKHDEQDIMDINQSMSKSTWSVRAEDWERIFGDK